MTQASAAELEALAAHHESQGAVFAKKATINSPWYHGHAQDTRRAAEHFAVAAALRACAHAAKEGE